MGRASDVVLLAVEWRTRALLRAQLIEQGFDVVATDSWPGMRRYLRPGAKPRVAIVDLNELENPSTVLGYLSVLMRPDRVLVIGAGSTVPAGEIKSFGFEVVSRPVIVEDLVKRAGEMIGAADGTQ